MQESISVVVVSHNTSELLAECLTSIYRSACSAPLEVWVVDNASTDGSADMVRARFQQARLVENPVNVGFAKANNQALGQARGSLLLLLNSDAVLWPEALDTLIREFRARPDMDIAGPSLWNPDGSLQPSWGSFPRPWFEFLFQSMLVKVWPCTFPYGRRVHPWLRSRYRHFQWVDWVTGAALVMRRRVYDRLGGLPEHGFMYGEDLEYCVRARQAGFKIAYLPSARVQHRVAGSRSDYALWIENYTTATLEYYSRYGTPRATARVAGLIRAGSLWRRALWAIVATLQPPRRSEARSRRQGYARAAALARNYRDLSRPSLPGAH